VADGIASSIPVSLSEIKPSLVGTTRRAEGAAFERRDLDDRDRFGKKRLHLAGPLLANLFRIVFKKLTTDEYRHFQKVNGKFDALIARSLNISPGC